MELKSKFISTEYASEFKGWAINFTLEERDEGFKLTISGHHPNKGGISGTYHELGGMNLYFAETDKELYDYVITQAYLIEDTVERRIPLETEPEPEEGEEEESEEEVVE